MENKQKVLIIIKGGMIEEIQCTSKSVEFTVIDEDDEGREIGTSGLIYCRDEADKVIYDSDYDNAIEEAENDAILEEDEDED